jgi:hypothetical protein
MDAAEGAPSPHPSEPPRPSPASPRNPDPQPFRVFQDPSLMVAPAFGDSGLAALQFAYNCTDNEMKHFLLDFSREMQLPTAPRDLVEIYGTSREDLNGQTAAFTEGIQTLANPYPTS